MKNILKRPLTNGICIGVFSIFYTLLFFITSNYMDFNSILYYTKLGEHTDSFWFFWSDFLAKGHQKYIAITLVVVTLLVIILLVTSRSSYDEYHIFKLMNCLAVAVVLTLAAIALFCVAVLSEPIGIVEKFMLFIVIHWVTVVLADLIYVVLCRRN